MDRRIKHNQVIVHVLNHHQDNYTVVLVDLHGSYVFYSLGNNEAVRAVSNLMIHHPEFLDRKAAPLWCSYDGKYVKTKDVPATAYDLYFKRLVRH